MTLSARVFALNALALVAAAVAFVLTPASIDADPEAEQVAVLALGVVALLIVNLVVLRHALAPLSRLVADMRTVDLLVPGRRVPGGGSRELAELSDAFNDMIQRLEHERQASATASFEASETERLRIARELHDQTSQDLTALLLMLDRDRDGARVLAEEILAGVRTIITELRPDPIEELGLAGALRSLCDRARRTAGGVAVTCVVPDELPALDFATQVAVYRVAQEAITNAIRHAAAATIAVTFDARTLTIADDGRGLPRDRADGLGLRGMRERALTTGATLALDGRPGAGTTVRMTLPV